MNLEAQVWIHKEFKDTLGLDSSELMVSFDSKFVNPTTDSIKSWVCIELEKIFKCVVYPDQFLIMNVRELKNLVNKSLAI